MGRSSSSCLKIIACGSSDAAENDDLDAPEAKVSSDKRGWSFRKRSGRHRVLGNNVSTDSPTSAGKETSQSVNSDFQSPVKPTNTDEKPQLPRPAEKHTEAVSATKHDDDSKMSAVVVASSENGGCVIPTETKVCLPVLVSENPSDPTPAESKTAKVEVVSEDGSNTALAEPKMANAGVSSEIESNTESAELKIDESVIISENGGDDLILDEATAIIIQSAIRGFLARRGFVKLKCAIKLQAAIRGHLVRKSAVETLHCIRAIVKVQALVRARSSKCLDQKEKPNDIRFSSVKLLKNSFARQLFESTPKPKSVNIRCDPLKPNSAWSWLERWMSVSTSEVAHKSEPGLVPEDDNQVQKPVASADAEDSPIVRFYSVNSKFVTDEVPKALDTEENRIGQDVGVPDSQSCHTLSIEEDDNPVEESAPQADAEDSSIIRFYSVKSKFIPDEVLESLENEENHTVDDDVDSQSRDPSSTEDRTEEISHEKTELIQVEEMTFFKMDALANEIPPSQADPIAHADKTELIQVEEMPSVKMDALANEILPSQPDAIAHADKLPSESEEPKLSLKRAASEELDGEGKKSMYVSRKASNPAFIAAQSKFEELSSAANPTRSASSSLEDDGAKSPVGSASSLQETAKRTDESGLGEIFASSGPKIQVPASECGTELSISSTLDSPDRCDIGHTEAEQENKYLEETSDRNCRESGDVEANGMPGHTLTDLSSELVKQEEVHWDNDVISVKPVEADLSPQAEQKLEMSASDMETHIEPVSSETVESSSGEHKHEQNGYDVQIENDSGIEHQAHKFSSNGSPISNMTVSESQGTPSSQVSVKGKKRNKVDKIASNVKRGSLSSGKKSPSKLSHFDSGVRSSAEHLPKDHKSGKRRNSFGSSKSDNADQEPRDSSSRNPLPSYMQATESARAKAHSPRSSPDVHDKDVHLNKRHSLPGASGRQGSPHIQRSASQAAESAKANGSSERKWQR